jgi:hypothetical protein
MKAAAPAAGKIRLEQRHAQDTKVYTETSVLPQVSEGKIAKRISDVAGVVEEQQCEWVVDRQRILCLYEHGVGRTEAVVLEAAKADKRVDVLSAERG